MNWRTTAVLFVVLVVVAGAAYLVSRQEPAVEPVPTSAFPTPETVQLVTGLTIQSVTRLDVSRLEDGESASFSREATGDWFQTVPTQTQVISTTMDSYATGLVNLTSRRTLPADENPLSAYGLDNPAYEIVLAGQAGEQSVRFTLSVGNTTAADDAYYVQRRADPRVYLVNKSPLQNIINLLDTLPIPQPTPTPFMSVITPTLTLTGTATITATVSATETLPATTTPQP